MKNIEELGHTIVDAIVQGATRLSEIVYEWYRNRQAPYYIPPPQQRSYEDQPEAIYPEQKEYENHE